MSTDHKAAGSLPLDIEYVASHGSQDDNKYVYEEEDADAVIKAKFTPDQEKRLLRQVDLHLLPLLIMAYLLKNIDGNSISNVKVIATGKPSNILKELHISSDYYAWTSTIFTIPFILAEVPSNLLFKWQTPRLHVLRIVILWSIAAGCHAAAQNGAGLLTARFFWASSKLVSDVIQGYVLRANNYIKGLFPGILLHTTFWYRPDELSVRMAILGLLGQFSGILAALIAYGIENIDGHGNLSAWRWMFIIEGIAGIVLAVPIYFFLPDFPDTAKWLSPDERLFLVARLPPNAARSSDKTFDRKAIVQALKDPLLYGFTAIQMFSNLGAYGLSFWLPSIIASFGFTTTQSSQLLNIPPAAIGIITTIFLAWLSDRTHDIPRPLYGITTKFVVLGAFIGLVTVTNKPALYALIIIATVGSSGLSAVMMPWRAQSLRGATHAAFAFAFQNGISQIGGIIGPQIYRAKYAPRYTIPYIVSIIFIVISLTAVVVTWYLSKDIEKDTRRVAKLRRQEARLNNAIAREDVSFGK